jgi:hypothetical protein
LSTSSILKIGVLVLMAALTADAVEAQEPAAMLAVRQCDIPPRGGPALREAFREFVEYATANTPDLPGNVYGSYRQQVWGDAHFTTIYEVANLAEYDEMVRARRELMANDETWRDLWRGWNSLLVPQSCQVSFHARWPG